MNMPSKGLILTLRVDGVWQTLAAFRRLPKEANNALRDASERIAQTMASRVRSAAEAEGRQAALMARTVKVRRDRVPVVQAGGATRVGRRRKPAYKLLFGSEFGSNRLRQFKPHVGRGSYWFFRSIEDHQDEMARQWNRAADDIARSFGRDD